MTLILFTLCLALPIATTFIHYESLRAISTFIPRLSQPGRLRVLIAIFAIFIIHIGEISIYAIAYDFLREEHGLGNFGGQFTDTFLTFFYFSAETFTSVGFGDIYPTGPLRIVCGIEALNGLLLLGWSASFTFIYMEHFWRVDVQK